MDHQSASMDQDREDAVFKMLMMSFAELEGKRLLEENERLKDDPAAAVLPELDRKCRELIMRMFGFDA